MHNSKAKHSMKATDGGCFHKGHYLYGEDYILARLSAIKNSNWNFRDEDNGLPGFPYEDADIFRMGSCELFSLALSRELNLRAYELLGENNRLIHAFCISTFEKQKTYIDVRGVTTNINEFCSYFLVYPNEQIRLVLQDVEKEYSSLDEAGRFGYEFACWIIQNYREYYTIA